MIKNISTHLLKYKWSYSFAAFSIAYLLIPLLVIHDTVLFNTDEYGLTFDILNRLSGVPVEYSAWPGGTVQFLAYPFVLCTLCFKTIASGIGLNHFASTYANAYFDVYSYLSIIRIVNTVVFISVVILVFHLIVKQTGGYLHKMVYFSLFLLFIVNSEVTVNHWTATAESMAVSFTFLALALLLFSQAKYKTILAGLAFGLAIGCKVTFLLNAPFFLVLLLMENKKIKSILHFSLSFLLSFILVCPYIWTDTLRLFKSVLGNLARGGEPIGIVFSFNALLDVVSIVSVLLFFMLILFLRQKQTLTIWLTVFILCLFNLYIGSKSGVFYSRYFLPLTVAVAIALLYIVPDLLLKNTTYTRLLVGVFILCVSVQAFYEINKTHALVLQKQQDQEEIQLLRSQLGLIDKNKTIVIPYHLICEMSSLCSKSSFQELLHGVENNHDAYAFFKHLNISESAYHTLKFALSDEEISLVHRLNVWEWNTQGTSNIRFHSTNFAQLQRFGLKKPGEYKDSGLYFLCLTSEQPLEHSNIQTIFETPHYRLYTTGSSNR